MELTISQHNGSRGSNTSFDRRWEQLKPILEPLFYRLKLPEIVSIMAREHGHNASETQYKYRFKQWGWKKNVPSSKKAEIIERAQKRAAIGKSTAATYLGRSVDPRKLRRQARRATASQGSGDRDGVGEVALFGASLPFSKNIFLAWNMPFGALGSPSPGHRSLLSPSKSPSLLSSDITLSTPPSVARTLPNALSPLSMTLQKKRLLDRARLFMEGRYNDLARSMDNRERRLMSTWLYEFWFFSFTTAKYWGRGPRDWTAENLGFRTQHGPITIPFPTIPNILIHPLGPTMDDRNTGTHDMKPSSLCRWSIHVGSESVFFADEGDTGPNNEGLGEWPDSWRQPPIHERLRNNLESNDFSSISERELPAAVPSVAKAIRRSPNDLLKESFAFAIMARNEELVDDLIPKILSARIDISSLHPGHLATSYLDGAKSCCNILDLIIRNFWPIDINVNHLGHTILDNLMIAILKAHTSVSPSTVDENLKAETHFVGEELDPCGRWDADSPCFRSLLERGRSSVPFEWKHTFCHTSVQAICHCIGRLAATYSPLLDEPSGLYLKYCPSCGQKLQFRPLHTLVLTAFHLANSGCEGEDLFGMLASLLSLITRGADPSAEAEISLGAVLATNESDHCDHEALTPAELAERVPSELMRNWTTSSKVGWQVFCRVLRIVENSCLAQADFDDEEPPVGQKQDASFGRMCDYDCADLHDISFGDNNYVGHIWAAVQAELLTYRRLQEHDPWNSQDFDMAILLGNLKSGTGVSIGLVQKSTMKPYCRCGRFQDTFDFVLREEATQDYVSNLDNWNRSAFIHVPKFLRELYY